MSSLALFLIEQLAGQLIKEAYGKVQDHLAEQEEIKQDLMKHYMAVVQEKCKDLKDGEMRVTTTSQYVEK